MLRNSTIHHRRSLRLKGYDYSMAGAYFVTICTQDRACLFGDVAAGEMRLNEAGQMVTTLWESIAVRFSSVEIDQFVVMPNHLHGILVLPDGDAKEATTRVAPTQPSTAGAPLWAPASGWAISLAHSNRRLRPAISPASKPKAGRNSAAGSGNVTIMKHIIRDEDALNRIRRYVDDNPARWEFDDENPRKALS